MQISTLISVWHIPIANTEEIEKSEFIPENIETDIIETSKVIENISFVCNTNRLKV
jgi:hypothetical protein